MTKRERRKQQLERHYKALEFIAKECGIKHPNGKKLSLQLLKIERDTHQAAEALYCEHVSTVEKKRLNNVLHSARLAVNVIFEGQLKGFFVNTDPRGNALKINDIEFNTFYFDSGLARDLGGNGLLAPEINGD